MYPCTINPLHPTGDSRIFFPKRRGKVKKILIIHTGGTFGMVKIKPGEILAPNQMQERITAHVPELEQVAEIDFKALFNLDSSNVQPHHWQELATAIYDNIDNYDGFVVIHGTDALAYTAAALSFMLQNLPKSVILTGSQRPIAEIRTDARSNLINAVELATRPISEVCIFFGTQLFRGSRAAKTSTIEYGAFESPNFPPLAEVGLDVHIAGDLLLKPAAGLQLKSGISDRVLALSFFPGLPPDNLRCLFYTPVQAIVFRGLGLGNLAVQEKSFLPLIEELSAAGKLVVITSQSRHGRVDLSRYQNGKLIEAAGAVGAGDMTTEATIVKLMHLLGQFPDDLAAVKEKFPISIAGEITERGAG
jgi:L-asparaginase